jgi:hypothetical protein
METQPDDFTHVFSKTISFINKLKSQQIELKSQEDIDFVYGKIHNLTIWLSGSCDLMYLDFAEEVESIIYKIYDETIIQEYSNCIRDICSPINLETLTGLTNELKINLIQPDIKPIQSSVTIEELFGGQNSNKNNVYYNLLFILFFGIFEIYLIYFFYMIFSGQATPSIGDTVYSVGSKYSSPKPYVIESQFQIYDYLVTRIFLCIFYSYFSKNRITIYYGKFSIFKQ